MAIYLRNASNILRSSTRSLATVVSSLSSSSSSPNGSSSSVPITTPTSEHEGPLRPHLKLPVNPDHGLYGFFQLKTNENSHTKPKSDGEAEYIAVEPPDALNSSGAFIWPKRTNNMCAGQ
jgi:large subunit ribosomal protein L47